MIESMKPDSELAYKTVRFETIPDTASERRTLVLPQADGEMVVDIWEARQPANVPPILLIHGWGGSGSYWDETANALAETAQVIVPDLLGTGRSRPTKRPHNMFEQVDSLVEMLTMLSVEKVQVVGHSMGGGMGLLLADKLPEKVTRLCITSMCFFINEKQQDIYRSVMKVSHLMMRFRPAFLADIPGLPYIMATRYFYSVPDDKVALRRGLDDYLELEYETAVLCANDAVTPAIPEAGAHLTVPCLLIACREDQVMPTENVDYTASVIPNCEVRWIEKCGHLPMVEKTAEYLALLHEFLEVG